MVSSDMSQNQNRISIHFFQAKIFLLNRRLPGLFVKEVVRPLPASVEEYDVADGLWVFPPHLPYRPHRGESRPVGNEDDGLAPLVDDRPQSSVRPLGFTAVITVEILAVITVETYRQILSVSV